MIISLNLIKALINSLVINFHLISKKNYFKISFFLNYQNYCKFVKTNPFRLKDQSNQEPIALYKMIYKDVYMINLININLHLPK